MPGSSVAPLIEVFASIQGEGRFVGVPMTFVRTAGCPIRCLYCDTPESYEAGPTFALHMTRGARVEPNPARAERAAELVREVAPEGVRHVSVTGGEPLLHPGFVSELGDALHQVGMRVHLESAALHAEALARCAAAIDHLSADYKLPGTLRKGDFRAQHRDCIARGVEAGITVDVKLVLTAAVTEAAVADCLEQLAPWRAGLLLVLQPVTPFGEVRQRADAGAVERFAGMAAAREFEVRVLPQVHKLLGLR